MSKYVMEYLEKLERILNEMDPEELAELFKDFDADIARAYAPIEKMVCNPTPNCQFCLHYFATGGATSNCRGNPDGFDDICGQYVLDEEE